MHKVSIKPNTGFKGTGILEIFEYRDLLITLAWRDFRVRYAQTVVGFLWAFLQPLTTLLIFTIVFGKAVKINTGNIPYPLFALSGMCMWSYFSYVMGQSGTSIIGAQNMIKKIYFPRLTIPVSKSLVGLIDFFITLMMLAGLMIYFRHPFNNTHLWAIPLFVLLNILAALSVGIWLSALSIRYRDFQHVIPFMVQVGLYATPVVYPATLLGDKLKIIAYINPVAGAIEGIRWCLFEYQADFNMILISGTITGVLLLSGLIYFKKIETKMADFV